MVIEPRPSYGRVSESAEVRSMARGTEMAAEDRQKAVPRRAAVRGAGMAALVGGLALAGSSAAAAETQTAGPWVVGAWRITLLGGAARTDAEVLAAFLPGGVVVSFDSPVEQPPVQDQLADAIQYVGAFVGQWLQAADGSVRAGLMQLNYSRTTIVTSVERMDWTITRMSPDAFTGERAWNEQLPDGSLISQARGTIRGERITVAP
jgi:hypothetical protein